MYDRFIYMYMYEKSTVQLTSVGLAQAHPNYNILTFALLPFLGLIHMLSCQE